MALVQKGKPGEPSLLVCSKGVCVCVCEVKQTLGTGGAGKQMCREPATWPWLSPANGLIEER